MKNFFTVLFIISFLGVYAQDCGDVLYDANNHYKLGNLQKTVDLLEVCGPSLTHAGDRFEAYRLLAIAYQNLNQEDDMHKTILKMLALKPDYQKYPNGDPFQFTRALGDYKVSPKIFGGLELGIGFNSPKFVKSYSPISGSQTYNSFTGGQVGLYAGMIVKNDYTLSGHILYSGSGIEHEVRYDENWSKLYTERFQLLNISVGFERHFDFGMPFIATAGIAPGFGYLLNSRVNLNTFTPEKTILTQDSRDAIEDRNRLQPNLGIIAGVEMPIERGNLGLHVNYTFYNRPTVNADKRFADEQFIFNTQYVNDDVKMRIISINLTYTFPLAYKINKE